MNTQVNNSSPRDVFYELLHYVGETSRPYDIAVLRTLQTRILQKKGSVPMDWYVGQPWATIVRMTIVMGWRWELLDGKIKNAIRFQPISLSIDDIHRNTELFNDYADHSMWQVLLDVRPETEVYLGLSLLSPFDKRLEKYHAIFDIFFHYEMCRRYRQEGWAMMDVEHDTYVQSALSDAEQAQYRRACIHMHHIEELYAYLVHTYALHTFSGELA